MNIFEYLWIPPPYKFRANEWVKTSLSILKSMQPNCLVSSVWQLAMFVQEELSFEWNDSKYFSMRLDLAPKISRRKKSQKEWQMRQMYISF